MHHNSLQNMCTQLNWQSNIHGIDKKKHLLNLTIQQNPRSSVGVHIPIHTTEIHEALNTLPPLLPSNTTGLQAPHLHIISWLCLQNFLSSGTTIPFSRPFQFCFLLIMLQRNHQITRVYTGMWFSFSVWRIPKSSGLLAKQNSYVSHFQTHTQPKQWERQQVCICELGMDMIKQNLKLRMIVRNFRILNHSFLQLKCSCLNTNHPDL